MKKCITLLGSTGSIGRSTLDVISLNPDRFRVFALSANRNVELLCQQCVMYQPDYAVLNDAIAAKRLKDCLADQAIKTQVLSGRDSMKMVSEHEEVDTVMAGIVGAAGLEPTLSAARSGKTILLANKEALIMAGDLFMQTVSANGATLLPIDSEHNALFQCMPANYQIGKTPPSVRRLILTASGGPFLKLPLEQMTVVTPEQAIAHPTWSMGQKISIDCATMMNKGLEVIEAHYLYALPSDKIDVRIHPQSIIHSLVDYCDGSVLAQLSNPDMRTPIAHALAWPERIESGVAALDLLSIGSLEFSAVDQKKFPCFNLAYQALRRGGTASTILNAANEVAVQAFLDGRIAFTEIAELISECLNDVEIIQAFDLDVILECDQRVRHCAMETLV